MQTPTASLITTTRVHRLSVECPVVPTAATAVLTLQVRRLVLSLPAGCCLPSLWHYRIVWIMLADHAFFLCPVHRPLWGLFGSCCLIGFTEMKALPLKALRMHFSLFPMASPTTTTSSSSSRLSQLSALICSDNDFALEYHGYLSNHLTHALIALYEMGASAQRLEAMFQFYSQKLQRLNNKKTNTSSTSTPTPTPINTNNDENWIQWIGNKQHPQDVISFFQNQIQKYGNDRNAASKVVDMYGPKLMKGASAAALHPLIHTGWALAAPENAGIQAVARGLAYCTMAYAPMDENTTQYHQESFKIIPKANTKNTLEAIMQTAKTFKKECEKIVQIANQTPYTELKVGAFQRRMRVIADTYAQKLLECDITMHVGKTHREIEEAADNVFVCSVLAYAMSDDDFFCLHAVTAAWAMLHIVQAIKSEHQRQMTVRYVFKFILAAWIVQEMPGSENPIVQDMADHANDPNAVYELAERLEKDAKFKSRNWKDLLEFAIASDDEHTQKIVCALWSESERLGKSEQNDKLRRLYCFAATKRVVFEEQENEKKANESMRAQIVAKDTVLEHDKHSHETEIAINQLSETMGKRHRSTRQRLDTEPK